MENRPKPSILNILQEETGYYSYMRVWGSVLIIVATIFLSYGVFFASLEKADRAIHTGEILLGIAFVSKVAQKFGEKHN